MYCTSETNNKIKFFLKKFIKMLPVVRSGCYGFFLLMTQKNLFKNVFSEKRHLLRMVFQLNRKDYKNIKGTIIEGSSESIRLLILINHM